MNLKLIKNAGLFSILLLSLGCGSVTIDTGEPPASPKDRTLSYQEYYDGWALGFGGEGRAELDGACPKDRISRIRNYFSFEDILISTVLIGIYTPHTSTITCAKEPQNAARN